MFYPSPIWPSMYRHKLLLFISEMRSQSPSVPICWIITFRDHKHKGKFVWAFMCSQIRSHSLCLDRYSGLVHPKHTLMLFLKLCESLSSAEHKKKIFWRLLVEDCSVPIYFFDSFPYIESPKKKKYFWYFFGYQKRKTERKKEIDTRVHKEIDTRVHKWWQYVTFGWTIPLM